MWAELLVGALLGALVESMEGSRSPAHDTVGRGPVQDQETEQDRRDGGGWDRRDGGAIPPRAVGSFLRPAYLALGAGWRRREAERDGGVCVERGVRAQIHTRFFDLKSGIRKKYLLGYPGG
jgi:hypothetical protein